MVFAGLFPRILISTLKPEWSLTIYNASSTPYTLKVMTIVAGSFFHFAVRFSVQAESAMQPQPESSISPNRRRRPLRLPPG